MPSSAATSRALVSQAKSLNIVALSIDFTYLFCVMGLNLLWIVGFYSACGYEVIVREVEESFLADGIPGRRTVKRKFLTNKMLLWRVGFALRKSWLRKPVCDCIPCMASIHSIPFIFTFFELSQWWIAPMYVVGLSGAGKLVSNFVPE